MIALFWTHTRCSTEGDSSEAAQRWSHQDMLALRLADFYGDGTGLQFAAAFHGLEHGDFVGVLDIAAGGNSSSDARDL